MARRSPAQVRRAAPRRAPQPPIRVPTIQGISARGAVFIARFERDRYWPGVAREALDAWARFVRNPYHRLYDPDHRGCGEPMCCPVFPDAYELRAMLESIVRILPRKDARFLRSRLVELDAGW